MRERIGHTGLEAILNNMSREKKYIISVYTLISAVNNEYVSEMPVLSLMLFLLRSDRILRVSRK